MRIMYYNEVDKNTITASSEDSGYPIENIQDYQLAKKWRSEAITNLIERGDCESTDPPLYIGETSAHSSGGTYERASDYVYSGSYSWKLEKNTATGTNCIAYVTYDVTLQQNATYTFKVSIRATGFSSIPNVKYTLSQYYDGAWHYQKIVGVNQLDVWERNEGTFTVHPDATDTRIYLETTSYEDVGATIWIDDVELYQHQSIKVDLKSMLCLIDRGDCESTTSPMIKGESTPSLANISTWERDSTVKYNGTYSYKLQINNITSTDDKFVGITGGVNTTNLHGLKTGNTYTYSAWVYIPSQSGLDLNNIYLCFVQYYGGSWHYYKSNKPTSFNTWQKLSVTTTINNDTTGILLRFYFRDNSGNQYYYYVDDIELYSTAKSVKAVFLAGHNLTSNATITVEANSSDDWSSPAYSQSMNYDEDMCYLFLDETYKWWRVVINDSDNPDGYIEIGRLFLGKYLQFDDPPKADIPLVYNDTSKVKYSLTGQAFGDEGVIYKTYNFVFPYWDEDTRTELVEMINEVKTVKPVILVPDEYNMDKLKPVYAVLNDNLALNHIISYIWNGTLSFREVK